MRLWLTAFFLLSGFLVSSVPSADAAATRFYDPETRSWQEIRPGRSTRNPVPREVIAYDGPYAPGTIVVSTSERRLYLVLEDGEAIRYGIGVGREGFQWSGTHRITRKAEWPSWTPPAAMRKRQPYLPARMDGGPNNPLGARAMYLGSTLYRIHGSNEPWTIGQAVSSGCVRMANEDVIHLYDQVGVGTKVVVLR
jgi:lipoprotein-anchoring transpeptidase ErfK/SrfK